MARSTLATDAGASGNALRWCGICGAGYRSDFQRCPSDGGELVEHATDPLIGATIGEHYVIDALIGEGAMGRVYCAHHAQLLHHRFAIKVLIGDLAATPAMRTRFEREAQAASRLDHPCVIGVQDAGRTPAGLMYLVMELVEGTTLGRLLRETRLEPARVLRLARQLCDALDHAHARGVIHRDVKPDNIVVVTTPDGELARIGDFGLAITQWDDARLTSTGVMCTPAYAAPEQLTGSDLDERTDLYALGTTLFEMVTGGTLPFTGDARTVMARKLVGAAPAVRSVAPDCPAALAALIDALLRRERRRRPASARDVLGALDALQAMDLVACAPRKLTTASFAPLVRTRSARTATIAVAIAAGASLGAWLPDRGVRADATAFDLAASIEEPAIETRGVAPVAAAHALQAYRTAVPVTRSLAAVVAHSIAAPGPRGEPELLALDVRGGGLRRLEVERGLERVWPALRACAGHGGGHVVARFQIDDTRRASAVHVTGRSARVTSCIAGVLGRLRTAEAPDTGDVMVTAELAI